MNNETYQALCVYRAAQSNYTRLQDEADREKYALYDKWCAVIRACKGNGHEAIAALEEFEKEEIRAWEKGATTSSSDTSTCAAAG